jgi:tryptophanyl-tRNA synthetase
MSEFSTSRVLSGIQPTADSLHLGNYLGALRQWVALQADHDVFCFVADLHSLTLDTDPAVRRQRIRVTAAQMLAAGIDPEVSTLFAQSRLPEHAELAWVLGSLTGFGEASRMTQFKDKSSRSGTSGANVGLFTYPILQAADILLYRANRVPVGEDQRQHLELSRTLAQRFNARYGETFVVPEPYILGDTGKIQDLQQVNKQMSKSIGGSGCLWLLDPPATLVKRIRGAVTDTGRDVVFDPQDKPGVSNLLTILSAFSGRTVTELEAEFVGRGYGDLKRETADALVAWVEPFQKQVQGWLDDPAALDAVLDRGAEKARAVAAPVLAAAYAAVGLPEPRS